MCVLSFGEPYQWCYLLMRVLRTVPAVCDRFCTELLILCVNSRETKSSAVVQIQIDILIDLLICVLKDLLKPDGL